MAIRLLRRARAADRESGLSPERLSVLSVLAFAGPQKIGALAEIEGVTPPAISRIVTSLENLGLAARQREGADAREVKAAATIKGRRLVEQGRRRRLELVVQDLEVLTVAERKKLRAAAIIIERLNAVDRDSRR